MYDIRQFKPTLYLLVALGLSGFSLAAEAPGLWVISILAIALNAYLVRRGRFTPLPRWLANLLTILALLYVIAQIATSSSPPLMFIGIFLVLLQLIKLFEQRANRDYVQIIVLSLLLMVAASINTASLLFGCTMVVYLVVSLYCCLIFHLKVEADRARAAFDIPEEKISPATLRLDQNYFPRSMRRLTGLVTLVSSSAAVGVFLFFPRGPGAGILGQLQFKQASSLVGFSEQSSLEQINQIQQNNEVVAHVYVTRGGQPVEGTESLYLRGLTLDVYVGDPDGRHPQWKRSRNAHSFELELVPDRTWPTSLPPTPPLYRYKVMLNPTGTRYLFAMSGVRSIRVQKQITIRYSDEDESIQATEPLVLPLEYEVQSTNAPVQRNVISNTLPGHVSMSRAVSDAKVIATIREYTLRPEVAGSLGVERLPLRPIDETNEEIARLIERHLKTQFTYTLDLTDSKKYFKDTDPVVAFLTRVKKGHCEYFASAMTLMCQSLDIPARMVHGFRCDEYNVYSGNYIVREAHAHAWVEVLTQRGWVRFDPTAGREAASTRVTGLWQSIKHFLDLLEHKWAEKVVAYDVRDRQGILSALDQIFMNLIYATTGATRSLRKFAHRLAGIDTESAFWTSSSIILMSLMGLLAAGVLAAIIYFILMRARLRRRAARIGLDGLPPDQQLHLARQLAFYDQLTQALQRRNIHRPAHQTPQEFAGSLTFLPAEAYRLVARLTRLLYRVRFGGAELSPDRQHRLEAAVQELDANL